MTLVFPSRSLAVAGVLFASSAFAAQQSFAQNGPARGPVLNWVRLPGAESCITPVELAQRVEARLAHRVFVRATDAIIVIEGRVAPDPHGGFATVIRVTDAVGTLYGTREFSVPESDCRKLDEIVSLVMAITIHHQDGGGAGIALPPEITAQLDALFADEASTLDPNELPNAAVPARATVTAMSEPPGPRIIARRTESATAWVFGVEAGLGVATGLQPSAAFGASLRARGSLSTLGSVSVTASIALPQRQSFAAEGALDYVPAQLGFGVCPPAWRVWFSELALCVDARLSGLRVGATDFDRNQARVRLWPEVAASASARSQLWEPSYLHLRAGVPVRLGRPEFAYRDRQGVERSAFQVKRLGIELELGLGVQF